MRTELTELLACPQCSSKLRLYVFQTEDDEIEDGLLKCTGCNRFYPIISFIPRMLPQSLYYSQDFVNKYSGRLGQLGATIENAVNAPGSLDKLKRHTIEKFGFEWLEYGRFGWDDPVFNIKREERVFKEKSLLELQDLQGKLVLDAGCGNGRYSYWAAQYGAKVIGVDLGYGVESAYRNTKSNKNIHIIQGDIFNLPFTEETFDTIFSIGVLMHTGDVRLALMSLVKHLRMEGGVSFHLYHKGNPVYEFNDSILRKITTRLSVRQLISFTRLMLVVAKGLDKINILKYINLLIRLEDHPHCIFDWYAAPIATHHTYSEAYQWCKDFGLEVIRNRNTDKRSYLMRKLAPSLSLTVHAKKKGVI